jgi:hypothetical protein
LKTRKSEQDLKNVFLYSWELELLYNLATVDCMDVNLRVTSLTLVTQSSDATREQLKKTLGNYGSPAVNVADKLVSPPLIISV